MKTPAGSFTITLALGAIILAPRAAQAQSAQEGPVEIEKCRTIDKPGSYKLVRNLTFTSTTGTCLLITADFVTIDLAGFTISGPAVIGTTGIAASIPPPRLQGLALRNGSISGFGTGVGLGGGDGVTVEELRVAQSVLVGMEIGTGIVRGNSVINTTGSDGLHGTGIIATGTVTGNFSSFNDGAGFVINTGSTVIGNTATNNGAGMEVNCPSNLTDNTMVNNSGTGGNLLIGNGCNNTNNVAP